MGDDYFTVDLSGIERVRSGCMPCCTHEVVSKLQTQQHRHILLMNARSSVSSYDSCCVYLPHLHPAHTQQFGENLLNQLINRTTLTNGVREEQIRRSRAYEYIWIQLLFDYRCYAVVLKRSIILALRSMHPQCIDMLGIIRFIVARMIYKIENTSKHTTPHSWWMD